MDRSQGRRSIRLRGYDYSRAGAYFVTVCTQDRACLFGDIADGEMALNDAGKMIERWWLELNRKFSAMETDEFVVMPNHFHGIVINTVGADLRVRPESDLRVRPGAEQSGAADMGTTDSGQGATISEQGTSKPGQGAMDSEQGATKQGQGAHAGAPLHGVLRWFKTMSTNEYIRGVKQRGWTPFPGKLWQRNYYEHIVRNEPELNRIRQYIIDNPGNWAGDGENPVFAGPAELSEGVACEV